MRIKAFHVQEREARMVVEEILIQQLHEAERKINYIEEQINYYISFRDGPNYAEGIKEGEMNGVIRRIKETVTLR